MALQDCADSVSVHCSSFHLGRFSSQLRLHSRGATLFTCRLWAPVMIILLLLLHYFQFSISWLFAAGSVVQLMCMHRCITCNLFTCCVQVYPTTIRALGLGICSGMARIGALVTPFVAQVSQARLLARVNVSIRWLIGPWKCHFIWHLIIEVLRGVRFSCACVCWKLNSKSSL